jgi:hypothetical protein
VAFDPVNRASIDSTEVVAPIKQNEIYIYMPPSTAGSSAGAQGGLIGALVGAAIDASVDSAHAKSAQQSIKPVRDAAVDYNFDETLKGDLKQSLGQVDWLKVDGVRVMKDATTAGYDKAIKDSKKGAVLIVVSDYQLNDTGTTLTVSVAADLFANNDALRKLKPSTDPKQALSEPARALYRTKIVEMVDAPGAKATRAENMPLWAADNAKLLRTSLDTAASNLSRRLAEDIQKAPEPAAPKGKK